MTLLVIVASVTCLAAAAALAYALRGRRADDHPVCRKCGFDLIGRPRGSTRCSECGADLTRPRAVRVRAREKRRPLLWVSLPLLLASVAWLGLLGWRAARGVDWVRHKPAWLLLREARGRDVAARDAALTELTGRIVDGELSQERIDAAADAVLDIQADPRRPWTAAAGGVISTAHKARKLSQQRWQRYAGQGAALEVRARETVRRGEPLVYFPTIAQPRLAAGHLFFVDYEIVDTDFGNVPVAADRGVSHGGSHLRDGEPFDGPTFLPTLDKDSLAALPDGRHLLRLDLRVKVAEYAPPYTAGKLLVDERREIAVPVTLAAADAPTVKLKPDESLRPAVERSLAATLTRFGRLAPANSGVLIDCEEPPVDLAFDVVVRSSGREWSLGQVQFDAGTSVYPWTPRPIWDLAEAAAELNIRPADPFEVVLRPSVEAAVRTLGMTEIWAGEVVFRDLHRLPPASADPAYALRHRYRAGPGTRPAAD